MTWRLPLLLVAILVVTASAEDVHEPGVTIRLYDVGQDMSRVPELIPGQTPNIDAKHEHIDLLDTRGDFGELEDRFLTICLARLTIPRDGNYDFKLTSDDGSILLIDGTVVIDHDGLHAATSQTITVPLSKGAHDLELHHFENGGGAMLRLEWRLPEREDFELVSSDVLSTPAGVVRVTSPGKKRVKQRVDVRLPGDGIPLSDVHPAYDLLTLRPEGFEPKVGGIDFLADGRLLVAAWEPAGGVYLLDGIHGDDATGITVQQVASGLAEPLGLCVVGDRVFVLQKQELTELIDHDGDDVFDEYRCLSNRWDVSANFHEFAFGLIEKDGWLYFNLAVAIDPGGKTTVPQVPDRGRTARVHMDTGELEMLTRGLRTPNGIGVGPDGDIFLTDNQGDWVPASKIHVLEEGAFYGSYSSLPPTEDLEAWQQIPVAPPVVWLPHGEIGNSPGEPTLLRGSPFDGQLAVSDVTHGGLKRVFLERVDGKLQGCAFRFTQGLEAGINRVKCRPNGDLFVGGVGSTGNWGQTGKARFGLQRLRPTGEPTFEMLAVRAAADGFAVELTEPLLPGTGWIAGDYEVFRWRYVPTDAYGGPKVDRRRLPVQAVNVSGDGRAILLQLGAEEMAEGHVYHLRLPLELRSAHHRALWSTEAFYTLNRVPQEALPLTDAVPSAHDPNALTAAEAAAGWELLFDGSDTSQLRGYKREDFAASGWRVEAGSLRTGGGGSDLITREQFEDFEMQCEWRVPPGGNSGIMVRVLEGDGPTYATGPEMQVLDDWHYHGGKVAPTSAGSVYALVACKRHVALPPGQWNHARIRMEDGKVTHWLNGVQVLSYDWDSEEFRARIAASKFDQMPGFATAERGHLAFQDHGQEVWFRGLKILELP